MYQHLSLTEKEKALPRVSAFSRHHYAHGLMDIRYPGTDGPADTGSGTPLLAKNGH